MRSIMILTVLLSSCLISSIYGDEQGKSAVESVPTTLPTIAAAVAAAAAAAASGLTNSHHHHNNAESRHIPNQQSQSSSMYPYTYLGTYNNNVPQSPSTSGSILSFLRPQQGGRRSSLTSRLRNFVSSIFRRDANTQPNYVASPSTSFYQFQQPPFSFSPSSLNQAQYSNDLSSSSGSNYLPQASFKRPVSYPYGSGSTGGGNGNIGSESNPWSNYKQWASSLNGGGVSGLASAASSPSGNYGWNSGSNSPSVSSSIQSGSSSVGGVGGSTSGGGTQYSSSYGIGNSGTYQAAASNSYPTQYQYQSNNNSNQRSSNTYKQSPMPAASSSSSVVSSASSSSSGYNSGNSQSGTNYQA